MNKTRIPYLDFAWNPGGFGCSAGCPTCWARRQATSKGPTAPACRFCRQFAVHFHPERLEVKFSPAGRKKAAVVGVQFLGDLFDPQRDSRETYSALDACFKAPQHDYVFLTRQYELADIMLNTWRHDRINEHGRSVHDLISRSWHIGTTCTRQGDYNRAARIFGASGWQWWVSAEPLAMPLEPGESARPTCIIIGSDNRVSADCGVACIRQTVQTFEAACVPVYVKQMWMARCPCCNNTFETRNMRPSLTCECGTPVANFLESLETNPDRLPLDLRARQLPWTLTMKKEVVSEVRT